MLLLVVTLLFFMMRSIGGSPLRRGQLVGISNVYWSKSGDWRPESIERNMNRQFGLDLPWYRQYVNYLEAVVRFDFGNTHSYRALTVNSIIERQGRVSLELGLLAFLLAVSVGVPLGRARRAQKRHGDRRDHPLRHARRGSDAGIPRRHAAHLARRRPLEPRPDQRLGLLEREDPPDRHARAAPDGLVRAPRPRRDARDARQRVRPCGRGEGPAALANRVGARPAELARAPDQRARPDRRLPHHRLVRRRVRVLDSGRSGATTPPRCSPGTIRSCSA